jgi:TorA maturation chaperone TorD
VSGEERELAELRAAAYRVLASALLPPTPERLATLVAAAPELVALLEPLRGMAFHPALRALLERLAGLSAEEAEEHRRTYATLFVSGRRGSPPPYESAHLGPDTDVAMAAAAVDAAYRSAGFVLDAEGEAPDHVAVELDFLSALCAREAEAPAPAEAERLRRLQRAFLLAHPLRWLPRFAEAVAAQAPGTLLAQTVEVALRYVEHDAALLESLPAAAG